MKARHLLLVLLMACGTSGENCFEHCWEYVQIIEDADSNDYFDSTCANQNNNGVAMFVPLPDPFGTYPGRECIDDQDTHDLVKDVIAAIGADNVGSLSGAAVDAWDEDFIPFLMLDAFEGCYKHVSGYPSFSDIDPLVAGSQACTSASANTLCNQYITQLQWDLSNGDQTAVPEYSGAEKTTVTPGTCDFEPEGLTTGEELVVDDTGVFGDVAGWVSCSPQTSCTVDQALIWNITEHFAEFYAEGVTLTIAATGAPCNVTGAKIAGLGAGEDAKEIADELDFRNDDVISAVEGISLNSMSNASRIINDLTSTTDSISITVKRKVSPTSCTTLNYTIALTGY